MAYDFNGTSAKISWGDVTFLDGLATFSCHFWLNLDTLSAFKWVVGKINGSVSGFYLGADPGTFYVTNSVRVFYEDGASSSNGSSTAANSLTTTAGWQSVGCSFEKTSTGLKAWVGGTGTAGSATTGFNSFPNSPGLLLLGCDAAQTTFVDAQCAELAFWNRVLTSGEWSSLASGNSPLLAAPTGLLFYARLLDTAVDEIGSLTGTITAATVTTHPSITYPAAIPIFMNTYAQRR